MKFSNAILIVAATAKNSGDRKVPKRLPGQRLSRLNDFSAEWLLANLPDLPSKNSWIAKIVQNAMRMEKAFKRSTCGFYDPTLPNGGPDLNPSLRPGGNPRLRRQADEVDEETDNEDYEDDDGSLLRYNKNVPLIGIKQITTGYRKWAQRYINECHGQRKTKNQVVRMTKWFDLLGRHWVKTQQ